MVRVDQKDNIRLADFLAQCVSLLGQGGCIDDGGSDIFWSPNTGRDGDLGKDGLNLVRHENIFHERGDKTRFSGPLVAADTNANSNIC